MDAERSSRFVELPLFRRELTEQAQRKRTYLLRCLCMTIFSLIFLAAYSSLSARGKPIYEVLGSGRQLFVIQMMSLMVAILALAPVLTCSAISLEKEKQTLGLLLISRLSPWTIVFEKLLSRMAPLISLLLVALPLLMVTYLLGGIELRQVLLGALGLTLALLQVTTVALFCSALLPSAMSSFWATYLVLGHIWFTWPVLVAMNIVSPPATPRWFAFVLRNFTGSSIRGMAPDLPDSEFLFFPAYQLAMLVQHASLPEEYLLLTVPTLLIAGLFLVGTRLALTRFAHDSLLSFKTPLQEMLSRVKRSSSRSSRGPSEAVEATSPADRSLQTLNVNPLAWRERKGSVVARPRMIAFMCAVLLLLPWTILESNRPRENDDFCALVGFSTQIIGLLMVLGLASRLFARERERDTLDTLLVVPWTNRELLAGKLANINRLILMLLIPLLISGTWNIFYSRIRPLAGNVMPSSRTNYGRYLGSDLTVGSRDWLVAAAFYLVCLLAHNFIYLHLIKWIAVLYGLRMKSLIRTMVGTLVTAICICLVPLLSFVAAAFLIADKTPDEYFLFFVSSPLIVMAFNEYHDFMPFIHYWDGRPGAELWLAGSTFIIYGSLTLLLRLIALCNVGRLLPRTDANRGFALAGVRPSSAAAAAAARASLTGQ